MKKVRIDKWLWSVRIYKSRTQATDACKTNKIKIGDATLKPSFLLEGGETLSVRKNSFDMTYKVVTLLEKRVSATLAEPCYENLTPEDELNKFNAWYIGKSRSEIRERGTGRPTKRERRDIEQWKEEDNGE
ncbi:MAG: ribosome-associated heat shock protein Hsp15 [Granulosicoccus sp.]|jgi:ribosome-associated heat shock protein Hsp15